MKKTPFLLTLGSLVLGFSLANASILIVDDFESYAEGALTGGDWTVSENYGTATAAVQAGGLSYTNGEISFDGGNRHLLLTLPSYSGSDASDDFIKKTFAAQTGGTDSTVYFRYTFQQVSTDGRDFINIGMSGNDEAARPSRTSSAALVLRPSGQNQYRAWDVAGGRTESSDMGVDQNVHLVIGRVTFDSDGNETVSFTLNPNSLTENTNSWTTISRNLGVTEFNTFGVFANRNANGTLALDNIAIADTWNAIAVPEPSTYAAILGLLALGVVAYRRRRR